MQQQQRLQMGTFIIQTDTVLMPSIWEAVPVLSGTNFLFFSVCSCGNKCQLVQR